MSDVITLFQEIATIPKCSQNAEKMYQYLVEYAKKWGFTLQSDAAKNIHCVKGKPRYCLQAHYDMVCIGDTKNLEVTENEGWLKAKNSSLGADNCIGLAMILSLMQTEEHLECLFTSDEEIGLVGARELSLTLQSPFLINLDTEDEGDISLGCAGGYDIYAEFPVLFGKPMDVTPSEIRAKNFRGGHSGMDIDAGIENALKELAFVLHRAEAKLFSLEGGEKINSIPKTAHALFDTHLKIDYDPDSFDLNHTEPQSLKPILNSQDFIGLLLSIPSGVLGYDRKYGVVSDSLNFSKVEMQEDCFILTLMGRSNTNTQLEKNQIQTKSILENGGCENIQIKEVFSAWDPEVTGLSKRLKEIYQNELGIGEYKMIHAGFECGVLKEKFPHMEMVSFGPNIRNPHSLSERVQIDSVYRVFEILKKLVQS